MTGIEAVGLVLSVAQILQGLFPLLQASLEQQRESAERIENVEDFIALARGLGNDERTRFLELLTDSSDLRRCLERAATRTEFEGALALIRDSFESPAHLTQIEAWAASLEAHVMREQGTTGERVLYETSQRHHEEATRLQRAQLEKLELLVQRSTAANDPLEAMATIPARYPDLARVSMDAITGGMTFEFRDDVNIGRFVVSAAGRERFNALLNGTSNLEFSGEDPDIQLTDLHPLLQARWGDDSQAGKRRFKIQHRAREQHTVQHFSADGQMFALACRMTFPVPHGEIVTEFGVGRSVTLSIRLVPNGDLVAVNLSANVDFERDARYDVHDLELVRLLRAAIRAGRLEWYGLGSPSRSQAYPMPVPLTQLDRPLAFVETFIEANQLLLKHGVIARPLPWPDQDADDLEHIFRELQYVVLQMESGDGGPVSVKFQPNTDVAASERDLHSGPLEDTALVQFSCLIGGRVQFVRNVELHGVTVRFVGVRRGKRPLTLARAVQRLGVVPEVEFQAKSTVVRFGQPIQE